MRENFLHYVWKFKKFNTGHLLTTSNESIGLVSVGTHNHNSGPDFFNAKLKIGAQLWAGNIEIHVKSSDWFLHRHEQDKAYENVILHVVYEHDTDIFRKDNSTIPTLELKRYINNNVLQNYQDLFSKTVKWINCDSDFSKTEEFLLEHWFERLYFERLERKSNEVEHLLKTSKNNWEAVLFKMLTKNFGLKVNADAFFSIAKSIDFSVVQKLQGKQLSLEALFLGQAGLLDDDIQEVNYLTLKDEYEFLKQKFQLSNDHIVPLQFFRLRPLSFPTIRLSQLANLYHQQTSLFSKLINCNSLNEIYKIFKVGTSSYWETHYTFKNTSKPKRKFISNAFTDLLIVNTLIPLRFSYLKHKGETNFDKLLNIVKAIKSEHNAVVKGFNALNYASESALQSQALVQLKTEYCDKHQCLKCAIGNSLLNK